MSAVIRVLGHLDSRLDVPRAIPKVAVGHCEVDCTAKAMNPQVPSFRLRYTIEMVSFLKWVIRQPPSQVVGPIDFVQKKSVCGQLLGGLSMRKPAPYWWLLEADEETKCTFYAYEDSYTGPLDETNAPVDGFSTNQRSATNGGRRGSVEYACLQSCELGAHLIGGFSIHLQSQR